MIVAVVVLIVVGLGVTGVILSQQQQPYPAWVPFLGDDQFELKAEFETAQAVIPGQGQTVNLAGVEIGDVTESELVNGRAVVTMGIEKPYEELIHQNATMLLRPRTGLQDMTVEIDVSGSGAPSRKARRSRSSRPSPTSSRIRSSRRSTATPAPTCSS